MNFRSLIPGRERGVASNPFVSLQREVDRLFEDFTRGIPAFSGSGAAKLVPSIDVTETDKQIEIVRAPGAFDLPVVARKLAASKRYDAIIALGAVIKGATAHFDYVAGECAGGLARVATDTGIPVSFGVLTTDTIEQAIERAGTKAGNKGADAAVTAIELANLLRKIGQ